MTLSRTESYLRGLLEELRSLPSETTWVEFKHNNSDPEEIGGYISALSNAATLDGRSCGYLVWGIDDATHEILGTGFEPSKARKGNEELESWLVRLLNPRVHFRFHTLAYDDLKVVILEIPCASEKPVSFHNQEWIRIGSNKKPLKDFPEQERSLWRLFDQTPFESRLAATDLSGQQILDALEYPSYFHLLGLPLPASSAAILDRLEDDRLLQRNEAGTWDLTNLGAILFARDLRQFRGLERKAPRVVIYQGKDRLETLREQVGRKGYAVAFEGLIEFLVGLLPRNEVIGTALRKEVAMYPDLAIRELIANALIHQDFAMTGTGPMIEVFADRLEITNPGAPLIEIERFLDSPPRSRNEALASFLRRAGICEERGSGVDKIVKKTEEFQLPPPLWERPEGFVRVTLFAHRELREMDKPQRVHACYLHACLRYVNRDPMTNTSLRERFGISTENSAMASRIIRDALDAGVIKPFDEAQAKKNSKYVPAWA